MLEAIRYKDGKLEILDQLLLPKKTYYQKISNVSEGWDAIKSMKVRGAPAISIVAALSLAVELQHGNITSKQELHNYVETKLQYLATSRPTAVNLKQVVDFIIQRSSQLLENEKISADVMKNSLTKGIEELLEADIFINKSIGEHGAKHILENCKDRPLSLLTHCNTGSLATAGYGTALGVVRWLHEHNNLHHVYCTETRPYNQGARLTAYELVHDKIPATLICDSMVAALMQSGKISAVVVGADRVVANGDTANKIGTYQIAVIAKYHGIPFYVASPRSTFDFKLENGNLIPIEERPHSEMASINSIPIAAEGINCWNPAFDVTPAELITGGIITECGVFSTNALKTEQKLLSSYKFFN